MLTAAALRALNHLLGEEDWASERLRGFVGRTVKFEVGPFSWPLEITEAGLFKRAAADAQPDVEINLPPDALLRGLTDRPSVLASARISGPADLAETIGFVFRHLRWDVEAELSRVVGDIPARRLTQVGRRFLSLQQEQATNLAMNVAEYLTHEKRAVAGRSEIAGFCCDVAGVRDTLAKLEQRIAQLEH
ncbi:ubiquinone biosynthesis accessory factor UbiJ [Propionivibrio soli]|uniref:ubiquinone biosynthesis accessory factor UbiJ n=1 Tax=Propionivibrio soli TaxID=2976531 RepID=UPI0021E7A812|nr:SCP2 sterol-binding domain-containing protein [Propionivibrio soli]